MIEVWIPGKLMNLSNVRLHWTKTAAYKRVWRQKVKLAIPPLPPGPKRVCLKATVWSLFDAHDGLRTALKPVVDGLIDARAIHSDAPDCGHEFLYAQQIDRQRRGVAIRIEARNA